MSLFSYNSVALPLPYVTQYEQRALYDPESQTDWFCTQYSIRLQCVLNVAYLSVKLNSTDTPLDNPAQIMNSVRVLLLKPRQALSYKVGGQELIPQHTLETPGSVDSQNGPTPQYCNIIKITDTTFLLDYSIVARYWEHSFYDGSASNRPGNDVLYNRWTETVELDDRMYSRRIREGVFRIRSDNISGIVPDNVRSQMAVLSIPDGFMRESSRYEQTADGLSLRYKITDKEVFKFPPYPAFKAEGEYTDIGTGPNAAIRMGLVRVKLYGSAFLPNAQGAIQQNPSVYQSTLVDTAVTIAGQKMQANLGKPFVGKPGLAVPLWIDTRLKVWMYDNIVEFVGQARLNATKARISDIPGIQSFPIVFTPGSDGTLNPGGVLPIYSKPPPYLDRGTAGLLLKAAAYYDPNATNTELIGQVISGPNRITPQDTSAGLSKATGYRGLLPGQAGKTAGT